MQSNNNARFLITLYGEYIDDCKWRSSVDGTDICNLHVLPCERVVEKCKCEAIRKGMDEEFI